MKRVSFFKWLLAILLLVPCASANILNTTIDTVVINTSYLDYGIWMMVFLVGLGLMILSNLTTKEQANILWATMSPFFLWPAAYFTTMIQTMSYVPYTDTSGAIHISIQQTVFHPEWLAIVIGIFSIFATINFFYILTKKPIEKPQRADIYGGGTRE